MRVVIAGDFPEQPPDVLGGIQAVIYTTLERLVDYPDLDIQLLTASKWGRTGKGEAWSQDGKGWTAHYLPSPRNLPTTISMLTVDRRALTRKIRALDPDIIHAHGQAAPYPWAAFSTGLPTVITVHGINSLESQVDTRGGFRGPLRAFLWGQIEKSCLKRATDIAVISPFVRKFIEPYSQARLHDIENPVQERLFQVKRDTPVPGKILYVGSIQKRKGLTDLIRAVDWIRKDNPDVHLDVAGAFLQPYAAYGGEVQSLVESLELKDHVRFLGHIDRQALMAAFESCSVFCLPSYLEASSVAVAEAMAAGCPVVTTEIGSMFHLVQQGVEGYRVPPGDITALASRLKAVLQSETEVAEMGARARATAQARFSPETAARKTHQLYQSLVSG